MDNMSKTVYPPINTVCREYNKFSCYICKGQSMGKLYLPDPSDSFDVYIYIVCQSSHFWLMPWWCCWKKNRKERWTSDGYILVKGRRIVKCYPTTRPPLTHCLLVSSVENLYANKIGHRSCQCFYWAWSGSNLFHVRMVFLKEFSQKGDSEKNQQTTKKHKKFTKEPRQIWLQRL